MTQKLALIAAVTALAWPAYLEAGRPFTDAYRHRVKPSDNTQIDATSFSLHGWNLDVERDRFTNEVRCRLYQGKRGRPIVSYAQDTLVFHFGRKLNTTKAAFRIGEGEVQSWMDVYPQVIETGFRLPSRRMDNPTDGLVVLPLSVLEGAYELTIRPVPDRAPRQFSVLGFEDALSEAQAHGCDARTGFDIGK